MAYLWALGEGESLPEGLAGPAERALLSAQVEQGINVAQTSSMGRLFDAVSALLGVSRQVSYEAQAAIELEQLSAEPTADARSYPWDVQQQGAMRTVLPHSLLHAIWADAQAGVPVPIIALRFHRTVANMIVQLGAMLAREAGANTVALSGGVMQNVLLLRLTAPQLERAGLRVLLHRAVPCNDGGVSLGQAALAAARLS